MSAGPAPPVAVGLLGPVTLTVAGRPVSPGGPRRRALLALLAAARGRAVSADALLSEVFDDDSRAGVNNLHVQVSNLRASLAPYGGAVLRTAAGYAVDPGLVATDAADLERELAAVVGGDAGAVPALRRALDAVRGEFGEDVEFAGIAARRAWYRGLRLDALECVFDAELQHGAGPDLAGRIEALLADEPLRERLWAQLVLALYASGRQAAALEAYRRARDVLAEEAGVDPGPALRELEGAVLRQADTLQRSAPHLPVTGGAALVWLDGTGALRSTPLTVGRPVVIGRSSAGDVVVDWDPLVSRRHAEVVLQPDGSCEVTDLGSHNGTTVGTARVVGRAVLPPRAVVHVGATALFLRTPGPRPPGRSHTRTATWG